jgi:pimeloyl-ACP methyl ester carboxylesterase
MSRGSRLVLLGVGAVVLGVALLSPLRERLFGRQRLRFPYLARPIAPAAYAALAAKPGWSKSELQVAPGVTLRGLLRRPTSPAAPWVLFYPGNDESQLQRGQDFLSALAGDLGWGLAVFAYRGYDASDGRAELASIRADAPQILAKLCAAESLEPARVHLAGFSIGGHFAVHAARGAALAGGRAASLTLLASVDDIVMYQPSRWEKLSVGEDYQTRPYLDGVPAPVLVLQGTADKALDGPQQGRDLARALGSRARYEELPGVEHVPILFDGIALGHVRDFVREHSK